MTELVLLDFDGTIYKGDSLLHFTRFRNPVRYFFSLLVIVFPYTLSRLRLWSPDRVKNLFLWLHFRHETRNRLLTAGNRFFESNQRLLLPSAVAYIREQRSAHVRCIVVSASCREWLEPFCKALDCELICSELDFHADGHCTGRLSGRNIKGNEKVVAVRAQVDLSLYTTVTVFGNTASDQALKEIATHYHHRFFE